MGDGRRKFQKFSEIVKALKSTTNVRAIDRYYMNERLIAIILFVFPNTQRASNADHFSSTRAHHGPECFRLRTKRSSLTLK